LPGRDTELAATRSSPAPPELYATWTNIERAAWSPIPSLSAHRSTALGRPSSRGTFLVEGERVPFGPGDVLFAEARVEHRSEGFSEDFATWVVF
jgi:hypothetical protein